jgi:tetratricopeptide (TPR) repeat protein
MSFLKSFSGIFIFLAAFTLSVTLVPKNVSPNQLDVQFDRAELVVVVRKQPDELRNKCGDTDCQCQIAQYTADIKENPENEEACYDRGRALEANGEYAKAINDFTKAINLKPDESYRFRARQFVRRLKRV